MSLASMKNLLARYSPVSETDFTDSEKESREPLGKEAGDLESASGSPHTATRNEKKSFKIDARVISDAIIGLSDGMTVPFALTAGLSTLDDTKIVVFGGLAELIAGAISMGLGGYLGAKSEE
jgi:hypothetical protein